MVQQQRVRGRSLEKRRVSVGIGSNCFVIKNSFIEGKSQVGVSFLVGCD